MYVKPLLVTKSAKTLRFLNFPHYRYRRDLEKNFFNLFLDLICNIAFNKNMLWVLIRWDGAANTSGESLLPKLGNCIFERQFVAEKSPKRIL